MTREELTEHVQEFLDVTRCELYELPDTEYSPRTMVFLESGDGLPQFFMDLGAHDAAHMAEVAKVTALERRTACAVLLSSIVGDSLEVRSMTREGGCVSASVPVFRDSSGLIVLRDVPPCVGDELSQAARAFFVAFALWADWTHGLPGATVGMGGEVLWMGYRLSVTVGPGGPVVKQVVGDSEMCTGLSRIVEAVLSRGNG